MNGIGQEITSCMSRLAGSNNLARYNLRASQVRSRYRRALERVYRDSAALHLAHTNNVFIKKRNGIRMLTVFVDESIFAAELNAQRELVQLYLLELFGEEIDQFEIRTSKWSKYRKHHPYLKDGSIAVSRHPTNTPLGDEQEAFVAETVSSIQNPQLRSSLLKAMTATLKHRMQK